MRTEVIAEELWKHHHREVYDFLAVRCRSRELAEDLAAETFLHATLALRRGVDVSPGWLITVARRRLADHWRSSYRANALRQRLEGDRTIHQPPEADVVLDGPMEQALGRLCESQRSALVLRYAKDRSVQQVADRLELSYAATESLLSRGRRRLESEYGALT